MPREAVARVAKKLRGVKRRASIILHEGVLRAQAVLNNDAKERLKIIEELKKSGLDVSPWYYQKSSETLKFVKDAVKPHVDTVAKIEELLKKRGVSLTGKQVKYLREITGNMRRGPLTQLTLLKLAMGAHEKELIEYYARGNSNREDLRTALNKLAVLDPSLNYKADLDRIEVLDAIYEGISHRTVADRISNLVTQLGGEVINREVLASKILEYYKRRVKDAEDLLITGRQHQRVLKMFEAAKKGVEAIKNGGNEEEVAKRIVDYLLEIEGKMPKIGEGDEKEETQMAGRLRKLVEKVSGMIKRAGRIPEEKIRAEEQPTGSNSTEKISEGEIITAEMEKKNETVNKILEEAQNIAPAIEDAAKSGKVHLKDLLQSVWEETRRDLPLGAKAIATTINPDEVYVDIFEILKENGIRTNAIDAKNRALIDELKREMKAAIIAKTYGKNVKLDTTTVQKILEDIRGKQEAMETHNNNIKVLEEYIKEVHAKRMATAERIAELLAEHVYANPNMKKELMKQVERAAQEDRAYEYLERFIENSLKRIGTKTAKGTDKIILEQSLKRILRELRTHELNIRAAKVDVKKSRLAINNLNRDILRARKQLEAERAKLKELYADAIRSHRREIAEEIAKILLKHRERGNIKFTVFSEK